MKDRVYISRGMLILAIILTLIYYAVRPLFFNWLIPIVFGFFNIEISFTYWQMFIICYVVDLIKNILDKYVLKKENPKISIK